MSKILGPNGQPVRPEPPRAVVRARYDAAQTVAETSAHWANADGLSAAAANSPEVRKKLRERARYERDNNCYCSGMAETLANDVIGTGPRLQVLTDDHEANERLAADFEEWTEAVCLAEKLRTFREARTIDGEGFLLLGTNPGLPTEVQLDLFDREADQIATPGVVFPTLSAVDGIEYDAYGNPARYHVLKQHPGDTYWQSLPWEYDVLPARMVLHWFKRRRPGQCRGVPEVTPALPLFALLRRYTLATVSAAEMAALFAVLLKSNLAPEDTDPGLLPFDTQALTRGMMAALPDGYEATQMKPEHPTTTYPQFKHEILNEIARCLNIPFNVAAGNSSGYNYSSGRLDHQVYHRMIGVDRYQLETAHLDRILAAWIQEARLLRLESVSTLDPRARLPRHTWHWDGFKHVDPTAEADAQTTRLANGTTTLADEWAEEGWDWREKADQQAEERRYYASLGIPYPGDQPPAAKSPSPTPTEEPTGGGNADQPNPRGRSAAAQQVVAHRNGHARR